MFVTVSTRSPPVRVVTKPIINPTIVPSSANQNGDEIAPSSLIISPRFVIATERLQRVR